MKHIVLKKILSCWKVITLTETASVPDFENTSDTSGFFVFLGVLQYSHLGDQSFKCP